MRQLVLGHDALVAGWVRQRIPYAEFGQCAAIGVSDGDRLIAGCVYHNWQPALRNIEMSIAADTPTWAKKEIIAALLRYPFLQKELSCRRVTACVEARNRRARRFVEHVGFRKEGTIRQGYLKDDCVIYGMLKSEARRWLTI